MNGNTWFFGFYTSQIMEKVIFIHTVRQFVSSRYYYINLYIARCGVLILFLMFCVTAYNIIYIIYKLKAFLSLPNFMLWNVANLKITDGQIVFRLYKKVVDTNGNAIIKTSEYPTGWCMCWNCIKHCEWHQFVLILANQIKSIK